MERKIKDFGMKIEGLKKNKRKKEEIFLPEIKGIENFLLISRDNIWSETNGKELIAAGIPQGIAYWREQIRKAIPPNLDKADEQSMINYFNTIREIKESVEQITEPSKVCSFFTFLQQHYLTSSNNTYVNVIEQAKDVISPKLLREAQTEYSIYETKAKKIFYGIPKKDRTALRKQINANNNHSSLYRNHKKVFPISSLSSFTRIGPAYLPEGYHVGETEFSALGIRGIEFGRRMSDIQAQSALDQCYYALLDLACILDIQPKDISLGRNLALSFGTRGHGTSSAIYKADQQVICLPNGNGNGFLAYAWANALDNFIGRVLGTKPTQSAVFALWHEQNTSIPKSIKNLLSAMTCKTVKISPEEQIASFQKKQQQRRQDEEANVREIIQAATPKSLNSEQQSRWNRAVQTIYDNRCTVQLKTYSNADYGNLTIEALSHLHKEFTGHVLPRQQRQRINYHLYFLYQAEKCCLPDIKTIERNQTTQYLSGIWAMEQKFAKTTQGIYFTDMGKVFARAFDCYVADKLQEAGIQNQFLTAHSEEFIFKDDNEEKIYAIPVGEERKAINQRFDEMIQEMKELGILHQKNGSEHIDYNDNGIISMNKPKTTIADIQNIAAEQRKNDISCYQNKGYSCER